MASGISAQAVTVAAGRRPGWDLLRTTIASAAPASAHCPIPPAPTHVCAFAHGAHESVPQLKSFVQVVPIAKLTANQPAVPSPDVTASAAEAGAALCGRQARALPAGTGSTCSLFHGCVVARMIRHARPPASWNVWRVTAGQS